MPAAGRMVVVLNTAVRVLLHTSDAVEDLYTVEKGLVLGVAAGSSMDIDSSSGLSGDNGHTHHEKVADIVLVASYEKPESEFLAEQPE